MCAKFGCGPTVVSKKGGGQTDRQRDTAALYSRLASYPASLGRGRWREGGRGGGRGEKEREEYGGWEGEGGREGRSEGG